MCARFLPSLAHHQFVALTGIPGPATMATGAAPGVATTGASAVPEAALVRNVARELAKLGFLSDPAPSSARLPDQEVVEKLRQSGALRTVAPVDLQTFGDFNLLPDTSEPPPSPPPETGDEEAIHLFFLEKLVEWCTHGRPSGSGSLVHVCKTATLTHHNHSLVPDVVRARAQPTRHHRAAQPPAARPEPWDIACVFELKKARDFAAADTRQALQYGEALLTSSIRPAAYVALTNGASIQFFRVTRSEGRTFAYLASDPLPLSAPIAKSLLCFMLTSDALFPNLPLFGDFRLAELRLLSETSNSRVVAATILTAPRWVASRDCVLKTVKLDASYVRTEKEALYALETVSPHVPVVLAASPSALLLAPLGKRIELIAGMFFPKMEGDPLYAADRLLQPQSGPYHATPQDDCEALVKVLYPMPACTCQYLRSHHRGDMAEYLQFWQMMANRCVPFKEALAAARRVPLDYDALRLACECLVTLIGAPS
ncbi:hypothetical protein PAPYR_8792 [Paratrimastix pyriformis]|uniref:Type I restriction enzyme R protein N-terminal domain-containing protein n=1 Tax=Paratrimastix pyriformis TaxID=342808 RepID=A0ABQ8U9W6_9EUKA|nr:hypothetical protein PAPYR_8792 [Paratrimastix pyriformis]